MDNLLAMDIVKTEVFESNWASGEGVKFEAVRIESNHWEYRWRICTRASDTC